jgi:hypothetical protein
MGDGPLGRVFLPAPYQSRGGSEGPQAPSSFKRAVVLERYREA